MRRSTLGAGAAVAAAIIGIGVAPTACAEPAPPLQVTTVMDGLAKPWDVVVAPDGAILTGERAGRFVVKRPDGTVGEMTADLSDLYAEGETGLMGIALASDFATSRTVYTCQGHRKRAGVRSGPVRSGARTPAPTSASCRGRQTRSGRR